MLGIEVLEPSGAAAAVAGSDTVGAPRSYLLRDGPGSPPLRLPDTPNQAVTYDSKNSPYFCYDYILDDSASLDRKL